MPAASPIARHVGANSVRGRAVVALLCLSSSTKSFNKFLYPAKSEIDHNERDHHDEQRSGDDKQHHEEFTYWSHNAIILER